ncbi:hypothetical protein ACFPK9_00530 [Rubritalea spongiae]|uniref:DUF4145 domain-containing protein n=1 Tax=Rubritalea spongiae TaxID=430797 RepID=A0ABW5E316_9BACT
MYLRKNDANTLLDSLKNELLDEIRDDSEFLLSLLDEDDWSFVIKSHALIEASLTELLVKQLGDSRIKKVIELLPLSDSRAGKIKLARDLEILEDKEYNYIRRYSELRNQLVHKVENINFTFESYISQMNKDQRKSWYKHVCYFCDSQEDFESWRKVAEEKPTVALFMGLLQLVSKNTMTGHQKQGSSNISTLSDQTMRELLGEVD